MGKDKHKDWAGWLFFIGCGLICGAIILGFFALNVVPYFAVLGIVTFAYSLYFLLSGWIYKNKYKNIINAKAKIRKQSKTTKKKKLKRTIYKQHEFWENHWKKT